MKSNTVERDPYIDILKGIGIISIVIGHSGGYIKLLNLNLSTFVYLYHIMIFFFVAGFCFKKDNARQPYLYIGRRLGNTFPLFVGYSLFFIILHNYLLSYSFLNESQYFYNINDIISCCLNSLVFQHFEMMLGALWFIPVYVVALGFFSVLFSIAERYKYPWVLHLIFTVLTAILGVYVQNMYLAWHIQTSVLAIPVLYGGYFIKTYWKNLKKFVPKLGFIPAGIILYWIVTKPIGSIELAQNQIISPWLFYPVTFIGIYFCLTLGRLLEHIKLSKKLFSYIGKDSYHIMALHFFAFKIVDSVYGTLTHAGSSAIRVFPCSFVFLWPVYQLAGIFFPLIFIGIIRKGIDFCQQIRHGERGEG